jgi:hypothetical protein
MADQWTPEEIKAFAGADPLEYIRIPVISVLSINPGTPDAALVYLADSKVFKIIRAYSPITRWLLNTGWFDGKEEK